MDVAAHEKDHITSAVRTDFIVSAETVAMTLGRVQASPVVAQVTVLAVIAPLLLDAVAVAVAVAAALLLWTRWLCLRGCASGAPAA